MYPIVKGKGRVWKMIGPNGAQIASIILSYDGEVEWIGTNAKYLRQGLATALWNYLVETGENPKHSTCRFPDGDRWARKVGGELPPLHSLPCVKCGTYAYA